ncbi:MAG: ATP-binding protein [Candidatus Omnitrophota bacterium]
MADAIFKTGLHEQFRKALAEYNLIQGGDRVLIAVSGGKDSLTLLKLLTGFRQTEMNNLRLFAAHIRTDFHCASCCHTDVLSGIFKELGVEYVFKDIKVLDENGRTNCFWCSWSKRKALFETAAEFSCNKIAFGHHKDDIAETILMNMFFNGKISAMCPKQELFEGRITLIRPLCYVDEAVTKQFAKDNGFPAKLCKCPFGKDSKRKYMKEVIREIQECSVGMDIKENIFKGIVGLGAIDMVENALDAWTTEKSEERS